MLTKSASLVIVASTMTAPEKPRLTVTRAEAEEMAWQQKHPDYKSVNANGQRTMMWYDLQHGTTSSTLGAIPNYALEYMLSNRERVVVII